MASFELSTDLTEEGTNPNPFSCNICKQSYTRVDHLVRHHRSHTREKPFGCEVCGKCFARADLLKRHSNRHNQDSPGRSTQPSTKRAHPRASRACVACAESKLRCEGTLPCGRCQKKGVACEYAKSGTMRSRHSTHRQPTDRSGMSSASADPMDFHMDIGSQQDQDLPGSIDISAPSNQPQQPMSMDPLMTHSWPAGEPTANDPTVIPSGLTEDLPVPTNQNADSPFQLHNPSPMSYDDLPFLEFLRNVMTPGPTNAGQPFDLDVYQPYSRDLLDFNDIQPLEVDLNGFALNPFATNEIVQTSTLRSNADEPSSTKAGYVTPQNIIRGSIVLGQQAFKDSIWLWTPAVGDTGGLEQDNLSLQFNHSMLDAEGIDPAPIQQQLGVAGRDSVLAMILSTCSVPIYPRVVSCFPSQELLTQLLNISLIRHVCSDDSWIHPGTLNINDEAPEFLAAMIASGAATCREPEIRKLGFAIQEAVRMAMPDKFESDNRNTRKLRMLQAYALHLDVSLWSGDRRKMEIAESFAMPLVTMMRRAGRFRRQRQPDPMPQHNDDEDTTESKWRNWAEAESFKRLALHLFLRDVQSSMSLLNQPLISYSELSCDLPYSRDLWLARTATEWKDLYLAKHTEMDERLPSVRDSIDDPSAVFRFGKVVDVQMSLAVIISSIWALIWQYRQMKSTLNFDDKGNARANGLILDSLHQESTRLIQHLRLSATEWEGNIKAPARLLCELCLMHLHVSLEDVQLLAGKEGEEEARKVYPLLRAWAKSAASRQAIYHAGQILRAAKEYSNGMLREASAVAVYHASLAFWAYAVLSKAMTATEPGSSSGRSQSIASPTDSASAYVRLDGEDGPELQRFLVLGKGVPSIRRMAGRNESNQNLDVPLTDPVTVMTTITDLLKKRNWGDDRSCPPLVMNLSKLMKNLGKAAAAVRTT